MSTQIFNDLSIFEQIKEKCPRKKIVSLCNKLAKKCSYKSSKDCESLCHLTFWLYIYEEVAFAIVCITPTHEIEFFLDYSVWTFIHHMWGLEIRILREIGKESKAFTIAQAIDNNLLVPTPLKDTAEKMVAFEVKRRSRFTYESVINEDKIKPHLENGEISRANDWLFSSLLGMIGNTETSLYPGLNERKNDIEEKILEYISELKMSNKNLRFAIEA